MDARLGTFCITSHCAELYTQPPPNTRNIDPARALGLEEGDAHVIRNAGGRVSDALRSIIISQQLLGTREIIIVHHVCICNLTYTVHVHIHPAMSPCIPPFSHPVVLFIAFAELLFSLDGLWDAHFH